MKKTIKLLCIILSMMFVLCACRVSIDNDNNSDDSKASGKIDADDMSQQEESDDFDNVEDTENTKKKVVVVGYTIYEPMNYFDEDGELIGFDTELAKAVFENLGYKIIFKEIRWENKYTDLDSGNIDCVWNAFTSNVTDDDGIRRSDKVDFSYEYIKNSQVVVVKKDSGIDHTSDFSGKVAAVVSGSSSEYHVFSLGSAIIKGVTMQEDCLSSLNDNSADFAVVDGEFAKKHVGKGNYKNLKVIDELTSEPECYAVGFKKGSKLTKKVNAQLEKLAADGTIEKIAKKYGLEYSVVTDFSDQK